MNLMSEASRRPEAAGDQARDVLALLDWRRRIAQLYGHVRVEAILSRLGGTGVARVTPFSSGINSHRSNQSSSGGSRHCHFFHTMGRFGCKSDCCP